MRVPVGGVLSLVFMLDQGVVVGDRLSESVGSLDIGEVILGLAMCGTLSGACGQKWWRTSIIVSWFGVFRTWRVQ